MEELNILLFGEFCERYGPRFRLMYQGGTPLQASTEHEEAANRFMMRAISADHVLVGSDASLKFDKSWGSDVLMDRVEWGKSKKMITAFSRSVSICDVRARGFSRTFCIAYLCDKEKKLMTMMPRVSKDFRRITDTVFHKAVELHKKEAAMYFVGLREVQKSCKEQKECDPPVSEKMRQSVGEELSALRSRLDVLGRHAQQYKNIDLGNTGDSIDAILRLFEQEDNIPWARAFEYANHLINERGSKELRKLEELVGPELFGEIRKLSIDYAVTPLESLEITVDSQMKSKNSLLIGEFCAATIPSSIQTILVREPQQTLKPAKNWSERIHGAAKEGVSESILHLMQQRHPDHLFSAISHVLACIPIVIYSTESLDETRKYLEILLHFTPLLTHARVGDLALECEFVLLSSGPGVNVKHPPYGYAIWTIGKGPNSDSFKSPGDLYALHGNSILFELSRALQMNVGTELVSSNDQNYFRLMVKRMLTDVGTVVMCMINVIQSMTPLMTPRPAPPSDRTTLQSWSSSEMFRRLCEMGFDVCEHDAVIAWNIMRKLLTFGVKQSSPTPDQHVGFPYVQFGSPTATPVYFS